MKKSLRFVGRLLIGVGVLSFHAALAEKPKEPVKFDYPDQRLPGTAKATHQDMDDFLVSLGYLKTKELPLK